MFALAPAWCPDRHPPTSKASTSSWDVCLLPSLEATQPKRTMASSHRLGVPCPARCPAQLVNIPAFRPSAAIKPSLLWERHVYGVSQENLKASLPQSLWAKRKENFLVFEFNYVSRCARGQRLKIKVQGCGVPQLETGLQCVHSSLEGGDEHSALCFFFPPLPVSGLILRRWVMTPRVLC